VLIVLCPHLYNPLELVMV